MRKVSAAEPPARETKAAAGRDGGGEAEQTAKRHKTYKEDQMILQTLFLLKQYGNSTIFTKDIYNAEIMRIIVHVSHVPLPLRSNPRNRRDIARDPTNSASGTDSDSAPRMFARLQRLRSYLGHVC